MENSPEEPSSSSDRDKSLPGKPKKRHRWLKIIGILLIILVIGLGIGRLMMPRAVRWYVNRTLSQNPLFRGKIGDIEINLWRGAYAIDDIRLLKTTGNIPVPLFSAKRLDLAIQWDALLHGKVVGRVRIDQPELNFVDAKDDSQTQTGAGGAWLKMLNDLFPFTINRCRIRDGSIHFRTYQKKEAVDVFLSNLDATIDDLTNVRDEITPRISTVTATATAMNQAKLDYKMKFDPFSYRPSFSIVVRLIGLDVTKVNNLARAYGGVDFERGWFDLIVQLDAKEGALTGYVKPIFRDLKIFTPSQDIKEDNPLEFFWEAVVGVATDLLKNQPKQQLATVIPVSGDLSRPNPDILTTIGNVLRNAFIRAYLPRLQRGKGANTDDNIQFGAGTITHVPAEGGGS